MSTPRDDLLDLEDVSYPITDAKAPPLGRREQGPRRVSRWRGPGALDNAHRASVGSPHA